MPFLAATHCKVCGCRRTRRTFRSAGRTGAVCTDCRNARKRERRRRDLGHRLKDSQQQRALRVKHWARSLAVNCRRHDKQSSLTTEDILELHRRQKGRCFWFGVELRPDPRPRYPSQPSVDRLDNSKPHTLDNCVLSCFAANIGRNSTSRREWETFLLQLRRVVCSSRKSKP